MSARLNPWQTAVQKIPFSPKNLTRPDGQTLDRPFYIARKPKPWLCEKYSKIHTDPNLDRKLVTALYQNNRNRESSRT